MSLAHRDASASRTPEAPVATERENPLDEESRTRHPSVAMGKKLWTLLVGITWVATVFYNLVDLPVRIEEGVPAWSGWLRATGEWVAEVAQYQVWGWQGYLVPIVVTVLFWWVHYPPRFEQRRRATRRAKKGKRAPAWDFRTPDSIPIQGIEELKRCQMALVKYMAIPRSSPIGSAEIAGSVELYPFMTDLCRILDEQAIPHPEIDYGIIIVDTKRWSKFVGDLWAVRHDIEKARRLYQEGD